MGKSASKLETDFRDEFLEDIKDLFPGCMIFVMDPQIHGPGIPDRLVLYKDSWAALEFKRSLSAAKQKNQDWYVDVMNDMSFAAFVHPGNREEIINELCETFGARRPTRVVRR